MRIAVISDTHDKCPATLLPRLKEADEIWHLGDVCEPNVLGELESLGVPLRVVAGNCDECPRWPLSLMRAVGDMSFYLIHIPPERVPPGIYAVLHGHTHVPRDEMIGGVRWLNPGCLSRPRGAGTSFAWLTVRGKEVSWELVRL